MCKFKYKIEIDSIYKQAQNYLNESQRSQEMSQVANYVEKIENVKTEVREKINKMNLTSDKLNNPNFGDKDDLFKLNLENTPVSSEDMEY